MLQLLILDIWSCCTTLQDRDIVIAIIKWD